MTDRGRTASVESPGDGHLRQLEAALQALRQDLPVLERWGGDLARRLLGGARALVAGNGGSAAQAQHLTAELVGRYRSERRPLSAIALHAETSTVTAIVNDYGPDELFARQVRAHGRPGDVLVALSTSGRSPNVLCAARAAVEQEVAVWALCGAPGSPLAELADEAVCVSADTPTVQEVHQVCIHLLCEAVDGAVQDAAAAGRSRVLDRSPADRAVRQDGSPRSIE
ncbi:D-sedoheptulose-7-phosphate isomerase [Dermatobacter hominis]|uniref:D-sedoheptulose-7-phosphate isomerase n=1 Tax=Dermatobacter hominis TaxID=2884263 RepID=UPI001D1296BE|nr:SIS domain-containing protein [Dermatobacter hominis]UDY37510.1 SIS domain-containing protein [Dermatobacter hominis]